MFKISRKAEPPAKIDGDGGFTADDIRIGYPPFIGDSGGQRDFSDEIEAAQKAQRVPFAIAPRCSLESPVRRFEPGDEVVLSDLAFDATLRNLLVTKGVLLTVDARVLAERARYPWDSPYETVKSLTTQKGIVGAGMPIDSSFFDRAERPAGPPVPLLRDATGGHVPGTGHDGFPGLPAIDGAKKIEELIVKGLVRYRDGQRAV